MSKGSKPRPMSITQKEFGRKWDTIFKKSMSEKLEEHLDNITQEEFDKEWTEIIKENHPYNKIDLIPNNVFEAEIEKIKMES